MFKHRLQAGRRRAPLAAVLRAMACAPAFMAALAAQAAEETKGSFVADIRAQNAHHLKAPLDIREAEEPRGITREWEEKLTKTQWELSEGPLSADITLKKGGPPDALLHMQPVVTLSVEGKKVLAAEGSESIPDNPAFSVQIAEMDPSNPYAEVVFSTYTGGAHCCSDTRILTSSNDGESWQTVDAGLFDGGPLGASDLDGDGRFELAVRDNAFLYAFGCYACSTAPLLVLQLEDGALEDVSDKPQYRERHVDALRHMIEWAEEDVDKNGYLAGYVAQKIRLGEGAQAWALMLKHYDRQSDWGLDFCAVKVNAAEDCPEDKKQKLTYPEALARFLKENGYKVEK